MRPAWIVAFFNTILERVFRPASVLTLGQDQMNAVILKCQFVLWLFRKGFSAQGAQLITGEKNVVWERYENFKAVAAPAHTRIFDSRTIYFTIYAEVPRKKSKKPWILY